MNSRSHERSTARNFDLRLIGFSSLLVCCSRVCPLSLSVDDPRFADEELVYSPSLPQPRWAPFSDWPRLRPEDPASRRYARAQWDAEQLEARRSTRRMDGDPGDGVLSLVSGSMAQRFERELAGMQREERIKVESKILASALRQLNRFVFKQDRGQRDERSRGPK